jgi:hypothetical protein
VIAAEDVDGHAKKRNGMKPDPGGKAGTGDICPQSGLVPSDALVRRFNELNSRIVHGVPDVALAYVTVTRDLPLLCEMQVLLSERPKDAAGDDFDMLHRVAGKTVRIAMTYATLDQLPGWTKWLTRYAAALGYSVRHLRRLILKEPKKKTAKVCGWSITDHNNLIRAATAAFDLVRAVEAGADTTALVQEIYSIMNDVPEDLLDHEYEPERVQKRRRPARRVTEAA